MDALCPLGHTHEHTGEPASRQAACVIVQATTAVRGASISPKEKLLPSILEALQIQPWTIIVSVSSVPTVLQKCFLPSLFGFSRFPLTCPDYLLLSATQEHRNWCNGACLQESVSVGIIVGDLKIKSFLIMVGSEFNIKRRIAERRGKEEEGQGGGILHGDKD